jgi:OmpA-OmpF porin, OOP family
MNRSRWLVSALVSALSVAGCAGSGGPDRMTCAMVGGTLGGMAGAVISHNTNEGETDEKLGAGALGAAAGAALGSLVCGEGRPDVAPTAQIDALPRDGEAPLAVNLEARLTPEPAGAWQYTWDLGDGGTGTGQRASHTFRTPGTYDVRVTASRPGARSVTATTRINVRAPAERRTEPAQPAPEQVRRRVVLRGTRFATDSAEISETDQVILDVAVDELKSDPSLRVKITGHTDDRGTDEYNRELSQRRAQAVLAYFTRQGIARSRLVADGAGESQPVASNGTEDGRSQNRRVELDILE